MYRYSAYRRDAARTPIVHVYLHTRAIDTSASASFLIVQLERTRSGPAHKEVSYLRRVRRRNLESPRARRCSGIIKAGIIIGIIERRVSAALQLTIAIYLRYLSSI